MNVLTALLCGLISAQPLAAAPAAGAASAVAQPSWAFFWGMALLLGAVWLLALAFVLLSNRRLKRRSSQAVQILDAESRQRQRSETELEGILSSMTSLVMEVTLEGRISRVVPTRYSFREFQPEELAGRHLEEFIPEQSWRLFSGILQHVLDERRNTEVEHNMELGGEKVTFLLSVSPLTAASVLVVGRDISERKRYEEELARQAFFDTMTGLPNRALLLDRLRRALARSQRRDGSQCAVIYLNLDRFRLINESLGHSTGDALIKATSRRIEGCLRKVDTVSRFVADEFVLLLDTIEDQREAQRVADRIQQVLHKPFVLEGTEVYTSASLGIAYSTPEYESPEELVRDAHAAMQCSRGKQKGGCEVFQSVMHQRATAYLQLETDMRRALLELEQESLQRPQFTLHFQPIVSLQTRHTVGLEALLRWQHPTRGLISPAEFIPLAEETGCILPLGAWVLRVACSRLALLNAQNMNGTRLSMSVNISARQLQQRSLPHDVAECCSQFGLPPNLLHLELTESMVMDNPAEANAVLRELKELGVILAMDDFGTGYSSLSHLYQFPFDLLKIDRSFTSRMQEGSCMHSRIIESILAMARSLGMSVVAEGVENSFQGERLREMGCSLAQGYHFARPMDAAALVTHLQEVWQQTTATASQHTAEKAALQ